MGRTRVLCKHCGKPINSEKAVHAPWIHDSGFYYCSVNLMDKMAEPGEDL